MRLLGLSYYEDLLCFEFFIFVRFFLQARGLKKHLKRLNAPKHWMLDKLGGAFVSFTCVGLNLIRAYFRFYRCL